MDTCESRFGKTKAGNRKYQIRIRIYITEIRASEFDSWPSRIEIGKGRFFTKAFVSARLGFLLWPRWYLTVFHDASCVSANARWDQGTSLAGSLDDRSPRAKAALVFVVGVRRRIQWHDALAPRDHFQNTGRYLKSKPHMHKIQKMILSEGGVLWPCEAPVSLGSIGTSRGSKSTLVVTRRSLAKEMCCIYVIWNLEHRKSQIGNTKIETIGKSKIQIRRSKIGGWQSNMENRHIANPVIWK